jgi:NADH:ubiquinone oxidoreductase subunit 3 (subunit A)
VYLLTAFGYVGVLLLVAAFFAILLLLIPLILTYYRIIPHNPTPEKTATYECGLKPIGSAWSQFNPRFYIFAVMFVALDVVSVFLYPWAVNVSQLGAAGLAAAAVLFLMLAVGYTYAWCKKALQWK